MRVYLVQHGKSKSEQEDPARSLTSEGVDEVTRVARVVSNFGISVSSIQHSGKTRGEQTARIFSDLLHPKSGMKQTTNLNPMDDPAVWVTSLEAATEDIMLVGHLPHLERLASILLAGSPDRKPVKFIYGGVVCLEKAQDGSWSLLWAITPEIASVG